MIVGASGDQPSIWRIDRIKNVEVLANTPAIIPDSFNLSEYAHRSFGALHKEEEFSDEEWRFSPAVTESVMTYHFHPSQQTSINADGSVTVQFKASGHLEMAWALYPWGHHVEAIKPPALKNMVAGWQRNDFPSIP